DIGARDGGGVLGGRTGAGLAVAEVPRVRGDRAVRVARARGVDARRQHPTGRGEGGRGRDVRDLPARADAVVAHDVHEPELTTVRRDLVDLAGEVGRTRVRPAAAQAVATDAPVAVARGLPRDDVRV